MTNIEAYSSHNGAVVERGIVKMLDGHTTLPSRIESSCTQHQSNRSEVYFGVYNEMLKLFRGTGFQPGQKLYEFGVGPGMLASRFKDSGLKVVGTDIGDSREVAFSNLAIAKDYLPFLDGTFDYVSATSVLHHISSEKHTRYMTEFKRILKPSGVVLIQEDERGRNAIEQYAIRMVDRLVSGPEANSHRSEDEWMNFFNNNGLTIKSVKNICHKKGPIRLNKIFFALTLNQ